MRIIPRQLPRLPRGSTGLTLRLLRGGRLIEGQAVQEFEKAFAEHVGVKHAIALGSARAGLVLLLKAFGMRPGDGVLLPSYTAPVVPAALASAGLRPVFCDSDAETHTMSPASVRECLGPRVKAILATHMEGLPCDMSAILEIAGDHDVKVIEDGALALGAAFGGRTVGAMGHAGVFSFARGKQLNTMGGGMVVTNEDRTAAAVRGYLKSCPKPNCARLILGLAMQRLFELFLIRPLFLVFVWPLLILSNFLGRDIVDLLFEERANISPRAARAGKLSNLQAAIGFAQLAALPERNAKRAQNAEFYSARLTAGIKKQGRLPGAESVYCHYAVSAEDRASVRLKLLLKGIDTQNTWNRSCASLSMFGE